MSHELACAVKTTISLCEAGSGIPCCIYTKRPAHGQVQACKYTAFPARSMNLGVPSTDQHSHGHHWLLVSMLVIINYHRVAPRHVRPGVVASPGLVRL